MKLAREFNCAPYVLRRQHVCALGTLVSVSNELLRFTVNGVDEINRDDLIKVRGDGLLNAPTTYASISSGGVNPNSASAATASARSLAAQSP